MNWARKHTPIIPVVGGGGSRNEFLSTFGYVESSRSAWDTGDFVFRNREGKEGKRKGSPSPKDL